MGMVEFVSPHLLNWDEREVIEPLLERLLTSYKENQEPEEIEQIYGEMRSAFEKLRPRT